MKKPSTFLSFLILIGLFTGCDFNKDDEKKSNPGYLTTSVNYTGPEAVSSTSLIWIDLYTTEAAAKAGNLDVDEYYGSQYLETSSGSATGEIDPGTYYIVLYVDADNSWDLSSGEHYEFYDDVDINGSLTPVTIPEGGDVSINIDFDDTHIF